MKGLLQAFVLFVIASHGGGDQGFGQSPAVNAEKPGLPGEQQDWSQQSIDQLLGPVFVNKMADYYVAGAAISVVKDGQLKYSRGFGFSDIFAQRPVRPDQTVFRIGSVTKVLTGVSLLQQVDAGRVQLDDSVTNYLDTIRIQNPYSPSVLVKHLLTHTSGFDQFGYGRHANDREHELTLGDFLRDELVCIRPPGELSCYDTYGITLAGHLVERLSGLKFEDYLKQKIFAPLSMNRSSIYPAETDQADVAVGYGFAGEWKPERWEYMNTAPASTVNSTVTDMAQFMLMLLNDGRLDQQQVLGKSTVNAMMSRQHTNHPLLDGYGHTFWQDSKYGIEAYSHGGSMTGFACLLYLVPDEDFGVFIACNQESSRLIDAVMSRLVDHYFANRKLNRAVLQPIDIRPERFVGSYCHNLYNHSRPARGGWPMRVAKVTESSDSQGQLTFQGQIWRAIEPNVFQNRDGEFLVFREDSDGRVTHLLRRQDVYEKKTKQQIQAYQEAAKPKFVQVDQKVLQRYEGRYKSPEGEFSVRAADGFLEIDIPGRGLQKMMPSSETVFVSPDRPVKLLFDTDQNGTIVQVAILFNGTTIPVEPLGR